MREILFKGKRVDNGEWVEGYFVKCSANDNCYIVQDIFEAINYDEYEKVLAYQVIPETVEIVKNTLDNPELIEED